MRILRSNKKHIRRVRSQIGHRVRLRRHTMRSHHPTRFQIKAKVFDGITDQWRLSSVRISTPRDCHRSCSAVNDFWLGRGLGKGGRVRGFVEDDIGVLGVVDG